MLPKSYGNFSGGTPKDLKASGNDVEPHQRAHSPQQLDLSRSEPRAHGRGARRQVLLQGSSKTVRLPWGLRLFLGCLLLLSCAVAPLPESSLDPARLRDGIYAGGFRGGPNKAVVRVSIAAGKISGIKVIEHQVQAGPETNVPIYKKRICHEP